ncbi:MAG: FliG C-terminal domain-containing protein [Thermoguttaceae bacterium]|jgi:flagellar motor switch protein FliG
MQRANSGLRKVAILVSSLDTSARDAVLEQMSPEQARQVRQLVVDLGEIDDGEQQRVIDEFFRVGPMIPPKCPPGIELDGRLAWLVGRPGQAAPREAAEPPEAAQQGPAPFRFLQQAEAEKLARLLAGERPQTIAAVLSHLPAARAAGVLARLAGELQVEVIRRLVDLEETDPAILREVEAALQSRLAEQVQMQRRRVAGAEAVAGILAATDGRTGMQILDNLAARDRALAERLGPRPVRFQDLPELDDPVLEEVFERAGPELMVLALFAEQPQWVERLLAGRPAAVAESIRRQLANPGPIRLRDMEQARRQVAGLARRAVYRQAKPEAVSSEL